MSECELEIRNSKSQKKTGWLKSANPSLVGFLIPTTIVLFYFFLGWLDNTTELWPRHDRSIDGCFWLGGIFALGIATVAIRYSKKVAIWRRIGIVFFSSLAAMVFVVIFSLRIVDIVNGWIDFPSNKTQTFHALLRISRAYQTHGKGASRDIQTTPIWSDMNVTASDYAFMLQHRRPGDLSNNPDEISSRGYFCAKVTMQRSGNAFRVLHAGSRTLPSGTVIICSQFQPVAPSQDH
jgi:hypothetical protein